MMFDVSEITEKPLVFVKNEFDKDNLITHSHLEKIYREICDDHCQQAKIKSLNVANVSELNSGSLVHFRCMVQDMYDSEFFFKVYNIRNKETSKEILKCGLYQDVIHCNDDEEFDFDSSLNKYEDRQVLYCIPIPGENEWAKISHNSNFVAGIKPDHDAAIDVGLKRKFDADESSVPTEQTTDVDMEDCNASKKVKSNECGKADDTCVAYKDNFPLPNMKGYPVIVKVYDVDIKIELNGTIDVFGVLSLDSTLNEHTGEGDDMLGRDTSESRARNPHPLIVPRIHALVIKQLGHPYSLSPLLKDLEHSLERCREQTLTTFQHCLQGDELASEYLLYNLLSSVYSRRDTMVLGKFSLNMSRIPPSSTLVNDLYHILSQFIHKSHLFQMTLENMNKLDFLPSKDYDENRLKPGILQLSDRTHLVMDETLLEAGKLEEKGVPNMAAMADLLDRQDVSYNFKFHSQNYLSNIRVLVLSEGKSILKCDCHVPLVAADPHQSLDSIRVLLTDSVLNLIRAYLCYAENLELSLPREIQEEIGKDFVESRKSGLEAMASDDLHASLTLARYVALSHGSTSLSLEHWSRAREMERMRKQRLK